MRIMINDLQYFSKESSYFRGQQADEFLTISVWLICGVPVVFAVRLELELPRSQLVLQLEKARTSNEEPVCYVKDQPPRMSK